MLSSKNALRKTWSWHQVTMSWSTCFWTTKGRNTDSGFIWFSREGSSQEKFIVWSKSRSCITIAFVHISECWRRMLSFCWQSGGHVWGGRESFQTADWPGAASCCLYAAKYYYLTIFCFCLSYEYLLPNAVVSLVSSVYLHSENRALSEKNKCQKFNLANYAVCLNDGNKDKEVQKRELHFNISSV